MISQNMITVFKISNFFLYILFFIIEGKNINFKRKNIDIKLSLEKIIYQMLIYYIQIYLNFIKNVNNFE